ncbi:MAG TPA: DEAD/DEAH box helicase [Mycobacteriales bacterium]|nr:DEAD/DEAH box helicase [Mycobacteriales bacterium]
MSPEAGWSTPILARILAEMAGPTAIPRPDQAQAVAALAEERRRVLLVQATGWGKSAVYWAATAALRQAGGGPTLVISPLLALMRDQVDAAARAGLVAATVNSTNIDDWQAIFDELAADKLDLLLVSPERLANPRFEKVALPLLARAGLLVVDEAHCISDWGFDFRPDYQRITSLLLGLTPGTPVLATTATANARVTEDVAHQLGEETLTLRGPLARASLQLAVVPGLSAIERYAWVAQALPGLPGSGIVYCLTVDAAHSLAEFLSAQGHEVAAYTGRTPTEERAAIEDALRHNKLKAVVATSALGMGYDKPDLGFCIHVGSPDSPVAYYQQVGRAGRALDRAVGVLLPAAESDPRIWEYFATATIPDPEAADAVLGRLDSADGPMTVPALESATAVRRGRLEALLKTLRVDGAVQRELDGWVSTGTGWVFDGDKYGRVVAARRAEAASMRGYADGERCLMQVLTDALDDPESGPCGRCSVCTGTLPEPGRTPQTGFIDAARTFLRGRDVEIEPRKMWPGKSSGRSGRIVGASPGRAIAFADDPAWGEVVNELALSDAPASEALQAALVEVLARWAKRWDQRPVCVTPLPGERPRRVDSMAAHVGAVGRLPVLPLLERAGPFPADTAAGAARVAQLSEAYRVLDAPIPDGPVLLVTDRSRTGWSVTVAAAILREAGVPAVLPLVGHKLP